MRVDDAGGWGVDVRRLPKIDWIMVSVVLYCAGFWIVVVRIVLTTIHR